MIKKITSQVKLLAKDEDEKLAETSTYTVIPPYDQAKALGKTNIDVDRISAGLPCGSEGFLLMFARWKKLERDLYNEWKEYVLVYFFILLLEAKHCALHKFTIILVLSYEKICVL